VNKGLIFFGSKFYPTLWKYDPESISETGGSNY